MAYTVTFIDYTPAERGEDDAPWTGVRVEQAGDSRRGPWTVIDTQTFDDPDTDPTDPATRTITTEAATEYPGWFRIVWLDATSEQPTDPEYAGSAVRPAVQEIANLMPDRTTLDGGGEARTFNTLTTPTSEEVESLIDMVLDSVDPRVPDDASAEVERAARHIVTLQTAILVESGNWGDQTDANEARVELWKSLLETYNAMLDTAVLVETTPPALPGAYCLTTSTDTQDLLGTTGRVSRTCWDWTEL